MRALTLRPDDAELFQNVVDGEKYTFFHSHKSAFKRMWTSEGKVYWLRFLLAFKRNFETTFTSHPEFHFMFEKDDGEQLQSFVYISIHKKFVQDSYGAAKTFLDQIFIVSTFCKKLLETTRMKSPFYAKESREAFRAIFGKPEVDEDIPAVSVAFLCSMYGIFLGSICTLLKRWVKEPELTEDAKKNVDYTYVYWKPPPDWTDEDFWPSCFEKYLASTYKDALPKMLLTADIHNIFLEHHETDCSCNDYQEEISIFELLRSLDTDSEPTSMVPVGYLTADIVECTAHSHCYRKIVHDAKCLEPYLCLGSETCVITCEKSQKKLNNENKPTNFWKKVTFETFTSKTPNKRHVSTFAQSYNTQVETFVHQQACCKSKILRDVQSDEFMMDMCGDPELLNSFNQHKRKEEFKKRLRTKFHKKYCFEAKDFSDPNYCMNLFENASKIWGMDKLNDDIIKSNASDKDSITKKRFSAGSIFNSVKSAETTVAVGTSSVLTGRIVCSSLNRCSPACECEKVNQESAVPVPNESKSKSKAKKSKSKKKKKGKENDTSSEKNGGISANTNQSTPEETKESSAEASVKKEVASSVSLEKSNSSTAVKTTEQQKDVSSKKAPQKPDCDDSENKSPSTDVEKGPSNGDSNKEFADKVEIGTKLCFGGCIPPSTVGHECSKAICCSKACCSDCVFIEKREFSTQTDFPQKTTKPKVNLLRAACREAAGLNAKTENSSNMQHKNCSKSVADNDIPIQKDGDNSKKLITEESSVKNVGSCDSQPVQSIEETSDGQNTVEESMVNNVSSSDSQAVQSMDETSKNQNTINQSFLDLLEVPENLNAVVKNGYDTQTTEDIVKMETSTSSTTDCDKNVSDSIVMEANEDVNSLKFETDDEKTVEDFLTLIGVLKKPSINEEEIKLDAAQCSSNHNSDADKILKFKTCAFCGKKEEVYKTFKRCAKCKSEKFAKQRYYCSRQCQVDDWQESHRDEHSKKS